MKQLSVFEPPRIAVITLGLLLVSSHQVSAICPDDEPCLNALLANLTHPHAHVVAEAAENLSRAANQSVIPYLVDIMAVRGELRPQLSGALTAISGKDFGTAWQAWAARMFELDIQPHATYVRDKQTLLEDIDPAYGAFKDAFRSSGMRLRDMYWSGFRKDEIPALLSAQVVGARKAVFLTDQDRVYGLMTGKEARAYPARLLDWHMVINDMLGTVPLAITACPYSGSVNAFETRLDSATLTLGNSGLIYKCSAVFYDHQNKSLWSALTGEQISKTEKEADALRLKKLPLTQTTWGDWRNRFPDTTVLSTETGYKRNYAKAPSHLASLLGKAPAFPTYESSVINESPQTVVYGVVCGNRQKAFPFNKFREKPVVNDVCGTVNLLFVADLTNDSIRCYKRGEHVFEFLNNEKIRDEQGNVWRMDENGLITNGEARLDRYPATSSFLAVWMTWYPQSELFHDA